MQFRSVFKTFIFAAFFVAAASIGIHAQTGSFSGTVTIKKSDGTTAPAVGVTVTPYRTDADSGSARTAKTNETGEFQIIGVNTAYQFALLVSGPGISPAIQPGVQTGMDKIVIEVSEGDGSTYSESEVRTSLKKSSEMTDEDREKLKKQYEENATARKKAEENYKVVNASLKAGDEAYKAKQYDVAIAKFDEGINADPEFAGSAPVLLNYKGVALKDLGFEAYRNSLKSDKAANLAIAKTKWEDAAKAFDAGLVVLAKAKPANPQETASYAESKKKILTNYVEVLRLAYKTQANPEIVSVVEPIYQQYFEVEADPAKKAAAKTVFADMIFATGDMARSVELYRQVIADQPDQPDALSGLGIALYTNGEIDEDKAELQEAANVLARFLKVAPEKHINKQTAETLLETLKVEKKITPKK
jgi:tetratricopeptide (TPR) repeat protein